MVLLHSSTSTVKAPVLLASPAEHRINPLNTLHN